MTDNLRIWDAVSKTDPRHTKTVNQRGGFTAISANYQILAATKQFGPIGTGWGYTATTPMLLGDVVTVGVVIWYGDRSNSYGPIWGGADLKDSRGKFDSDAPKKAETDGLTKGLSQLGFNADVFLGKFDDSKYVEEMRREFEAADRANEPIIDDAQTAQLMTLIEQTGAETRAICKHYRIRVLTQLPASQFEDCRRQLNDMLRKAA